MVRELNKPEGGVERVFDEKILLHVKNSDSIPHLTQVAQRLTLIDSFVDAVNNLNFQPTDQSIKNLNRMFKKMIDAASEIDGCLNFTNDIFKPEKLSLINTWCEKRRKARLYDHKSTKNRDLEKLFTRIMGSAFPRPAKSLFDTIIEMDSMSELASANIEQVKEKKTL